MVERGGPGRRARTQTWLMGDDVRASAGPRQRGHTGSGGRYQPAGIVRRGE